MHIFTNFKYIFFYLHLRRFGATRTWSCSPCHSFASATCRHCRRPGGRPTRLLLRCTVVVVVGVEAHPLDRLEGARENYFFCHFKFIIIAILCIIIRIFCILHIFLLDFSRPWNAAYGDEIGIAGFLAGLHIFKVLFYFYAFVFYIYSK